MDWATTEDDFNEDYDLWWSDLPISNEKFEEFEPNQKINHFPGTFQICRKNLLAKNLNAMRKIFPKEYSFYPRTWHLPYEAEDFREQFCGKPKTFIIKPETGC